MPKKIDENKVFETVISDWVKNGYSGSTTREIAKLAGINEATLFRRYGNKAQLFAKAIDQQLADTPLSNIQISGDINQDLMGLAEAYIATFEIHGDVVFKTIQEMPKHPEIKDAVVNLLNNIQNMLKLIALHQQKGQLKKEHPMITLTSFIGPIATYLMFRESKLSDDVPQFNVNEYVSLFLSGRGV